MFQFDEGKFKNASSKVLSALKKIKDKDTVIKEIINLDVGTYENKDQVERICSNCLTIEKILEDLEFNIGKTEEMMNIHASKPNFVISGVGQFANITNTEEKEAYDQYDFEIDQMKEEYVGLSIEAFSQKIRNNLILSEEEKKEMEKYYAEGNMNAAMLIMIIAIREDRILKLEEELKELDYYRGGIERGASITSFSEEDQERYYELLKLEEERNQIKMELYDLRVAYDLAKFNDVRKIRGSNEYQEAVESQIQFGKEFIEYLESKNGVWDPVQMSPALLDNYLDYFLAENGYTDTSGTIIYKQYNEMAIWSVLSQSEDFWNWLEGCGLASERTRDEVLLAFPTIAGGNDLYSRAFLYMSEDEMNDYHYLCAMSGEDAVELSRANEYIEAMEDDLNWRNATDLCNGDFFDIINGKSTLLDIVSTCMPGLKLVDNLVTTAFGSENANNTFFDRFSIINEKGLFIGFDRFGEDIISKFAPDSTRTVNEYRTMFLLQACNCSVINEELTIEHIMYYRENGSINDEEKNNLLNRMMMGESLVYGDLLLLNGSIDKSTYEAWQIFNESEEYQQFEKSLSETERNVLGYSYEIGDASGYMIPSIAFSYGATSLGVPSTFAQLGANALRFLASSSSKTRENLRAGDSLSEAKIGASRSAVIEQLAEVLVAQFPGLSIGKTPGTPQKQGFLWKLLDLGRDAIEEPLEDIVTIFSENGDLDGYTLNDFLHSLIVGAGVGVELEGMTSPITGIFSGSDWVDLDAVREDLKNETPLDLSNVKTLDDLAIALSNIKTSDLGSNFLNLANNLAKLNVIISGMNLPTVTIKDGKFVFNGITDEATLARLDAYQSLRGSENGIIESIFSLSSDSVKVDILNHVSLSMNVVGSIINSITNSSIKLNLLEKYKNQISVDNLINIILRSNDVEFQNEAVNKYIGYEQLMSLKDMAQSDGRNMIQLTDFTKLPVVINKIIENNWTNLMYYYVGEDFNIIKQIFEILLPENEYSFNEKDLSNWMDIWCNMGAWSSYTQSIKVADHEKLIALVKSLYDFKKFLPDIDVNHLIKYGFKANIEDLIKISNNGLSSQFIDFYTHIKDICFTSIESANGVSTFFELAKFFNKYQSFAIELTNNGEALKNNLSNFLYLFNYNGTLEISNISDFLNLNQTINNEIKTAIDNPNISVTELRSTLLTYLCNITFDEFKNILSNDINLTIIDKILSKDLVEEARKKIETLKVYITFINDTIYKISDSAQLKKMLENIDSESGREKYKDLFQYCSFIKEFIRQAYEEDANATLTNISTLPSELYNLDGGYFDLSNSVHAFYVHSTNFKNLNGLVNPRFAGFLFQCLTTTSDKMRPSFYGENKPGGSDNILILYDSLPKGSYIGSAWGDLSSNGFTSFNSYKMDKVQYRQNEIISNALRPAMSETDVYRENLKPAGILIKGSEPTEVERNAAKELGELLGLDEPLPLIKTQSTNTKIENPQPISKSKSEEIEILDIE